MPTTLDDVFAKSAERPPLHPRLKNLRARMALGATVQLEVYRPNSVLGIGQCDMYLHIAENGKPQTLEELPWDDELNAGLIEFGVRAINIPNEIERFGLGFRADLRRATREFGDGYFNAVLLELVRDSDLANSPDIAEVLRHAFASLPNHGKIYEPCREMIFNAISGRRYELETKLKYGESEAKRILIKAFARYVDERFSVSSRRRLGLL